MARVQTFILGDPWTETNYQWDATNNLQWNEV